MTRLDPPPSSWVAVRWLASQALLTLLASLPAVLAAAADPAPGDAVALDNKILREAENGSEIMANLTHLSDVIGPRLTGSPALKQANEWAADKMRAYALSNVHQEPWSIPVGWQRGTASLRIVEPSNGLTLTVAAKAWTPGTQGRIEGNVVAIDSRKPSALAAFKGKLKGAVVLLGKPSKVRPITPGPKGKGKAKEKGKGQGATNPAAKPEVQPKPKPDPKLSRKELLEFLRLEGAAVLLIDAGKPLGLLDTDGGWRHVEPLPSLYVVHEHYGLLHRLASRPSPARTRVEAEVTSRLVPGPIAVYNTVGELRGSEKPDEFVVLGAHLDSWDLGQGTTDNGTGTSVVLESARILVNSGVQPRRTIRFVLFTGEEQGLHGSRAYVKKHRSEMARTSMALVHDNGTGRVVGMNLQGREAIKSILETELVSLKKLGVTKIGLRSTDDTDHASFERAGGPGFDVRQDPAEYELSYHSQLDTLDKAREPDLIQGAQVMAVTALRVANLPGLLPR